MIGLRAVVLVVALGAAACGAPLMKLPEGPGVPAPDASALLAQATTACSRVSSLSVEVGVHGSVTGSGVRGRLLVGLAGRDGMYIEAPAPFGAPAFVLGAVDGDATLLLPRDKRVDEHGTAGQMLEVIAGVPLEAADLRATLTGCPPSMPSTASDARRIGDTWCVISGSTTVYMKRDEKTWRIVSVVRSGADGWRTDFAAFVENLPRTVRVISNTARRFDLRLELSQVELNPRLDPRTFHVVVPAGTQSISLTEFRAGGPLSR
jgi:hypothetical protein